MHVKLEACLETVLVLLDLDITSRSITQEVRVEIIEDVPYFRLEYLFHLMVRFIFIHWNEAPEEILSNVNFCDFNRLNIFSLVVPMVPGVFLDSLHESTYLFPQTCRVTGTLRCKTNPDIASTWVAPVKDVLDDQAVHACLHVSPKLD